MNLNWNEYHTFKEIKPGEYSNGIRLFQMNSERTWDKNGKTLFVNKFEGYDQGFNPYNKVDSYYKDDPKKYQRQIIKYSFTVLFLIACIAFILAFIYAYKFRDCKKRIA